MADIHKYNANNFLLRMNPIASETLFYYLSYIPIKFRIDGPWLCGGSLRRAISNQDFKGADFDVFFKDADQFGFAIQMLENQNFNKIKDEPHAVTYKKVTKDFKEVIVQLIRMNYYNCIEEAICDFDYTVAMTGYDGTNIYVGPYTLYDIARKRLVVNKITYPVAALRRLLKYNNQGYYACTGCLQEIANSIHTMTPIDFKQNQTTYVD